MLAALLFYREYAYMEVWQYACSAAGIATVCSGVGFSTLDALPPTLERTRLSLARVLMPKQFAKVNPALAPAGASTEASGSAFFSPRVPPAGPPAKGSSKFAAALAGRGGGGAAPGVAPGAVAGAEGADALTVTPMDEPAPPASADEPARADSLTDSPAPAPADDAAALAAGDEEAGEGGGEA